MDGKSQSAAGKAGQASYQFSRAGPCLNTLFFEKVSSLKQSRGSYGDLSQQQYLTQCAQKASTGDSLIPQLAEADLKIDEVRRAQRRLNHRKFPAPPFRVYPAPTAPRQC